MLWTADRLDTDQVDTDKPSTPKRKCGNHVQERSKLKVRTVTKKTTQSLESIFKHEDDEIPHTIYYNKSLGQLFCTLCQNI